MARCTRCPGRDQKKWRFGTVLLHIRFNWMAWWGVPPPGQTCTLDSIEWPDDVIQSCGEVTVEIRIGEKKNQGDTYPIELNGLMMSFQREYVLWIEGSMQGTMEQWRMEQWMDVGVVWYSWVSSPRCPRCLEVFCFAFQLSVSNTRRKSWLPTIFTSSSFASWMTWTWEWS